MLLAMVRSLWTFLALKILTRQTALLPGLDGTVVLLCVTCLDSKHPPGMTNHSTAIKMDYIGIHQNDIPRGRNPEASFFWTWLVLVLYQPILSCVKTSFVLFLLQLGGTKTGVRYACWALLAINNLMLLGFLLATIFQCTPVSHYWQRGATLRDGGGGDGRCIEPALFSLANSAFNIATDLAVLGLPLWIFTGLRMHRRAKIGLMVVFTMGFM
jgi:hypothetical protein